MDHLEIDSRSNNSGEMPLFSVLTTELRVSLLIMYEAWPDDPTSASGRPTSACTYSSERVFKDFHPLDSR